MKFSFIFIAIGVLIVSSVMFFKPPTKEEIEKSRDQYAQLSTDKSLKVATFAGGCFWCIEGPFEQIEGVKEAFSGFSGGNVENPTYEQVINGETGHRESVQVFYDPNLVDYETLVQTFWYQIDPTDPGGQFADRGEHYTTAIFYHDKDQKQIADTSKKMLNESGTYENEIVTKIVEFKNFYLAEDYHQDYYKKSEQRYKNYETLSGRKGYKDKIKETLDNILN